MVEQDKQATPHIVARDICLDFPVGNFTPSLKGTIRQSVGGMFRKSELGTYSIRALSYLDFTLQAGDRVGLLGHNGAGKSTLLQLLNRGYYPTSGELLIEGRSIPLLNLGNGADPEFSGRENILLLGLHLGLTPTEIEARQDDIIDFSELGDFIDMPLRSYSAGMYLRLAYSIATSVDPDILLVDEIFGAGDSGFYEKARERMENLMERSGILVLATHSVDLIRQYCNKVMVLDQGRLACFDEPEKAIYEYALLLENARAEEKST